MIVSDERGLLSGLVVAELARERLLVEMDDFVVNLQRLVRLELLPASLAHVHLYTVLNYQQHRNGNGWK
jgi:hypothetical protein